MRKNNSVSLVGKISLPQSETPYSTALLKTILSHILRKNAPKSKKNKPKRKTFSDTILSIFTKKFMEKNYQPSPKLLLIHHPEVSAEEEAEVLSGLHLIYLHPMIKTPGRNADNAHIQGMDSNAQLLKSIWDVTLVES